MAPKQPVAPAAKPVVLMIDSLRVDLSKCVPMLAGDWVILKRIGVRLGPNHNLVDEPDAMVSFVLHFVHKLHPDVPREKLLELPMARLIKAARYLNEASQTEDDDPN